MQIEIDFEVFKALTALRQSEVDSLNAVIRRLVDLPFDSSADTIVERVRRNALILRENSNEQLMSKKLGYSQEYKAVLVKDELVARYERGLWLGSICLPMGAKLRATYKGRTYAAEIDDGKWIGEDQIVRNSPSDAAKAITKTNVNGWRFWSVQLPGNPAWRKLEEI